MKQLISSVLLVGLVSCAEAPTPYQMKVPQDAANAEGQNNSAGKPDLSTGGPNANAGEMNAPGPAADPGPVAQIPAPAPGPANPEGNNPADTKPVDTLSFAKEIESYRWLFPCDKDVGTNEICESKAGSDVTKTFGGEAGKVYDVELRFRGVVEPMKYKGGTKEGDYFYIGGTADDPTYNIYSIEVSEPKQIYYVNRQDNTGHITFLIDYKAVIPVAAGAKLRLVGNGQNGLEIANFKDLMVPELDQQAYNGQYAQINVVSVKERTQTQQAKK